VPAKVPFRNSKGNPSPSRKRGLRLGGEDGQSKGRVADLERGKRMGQSRGRRGRRSCRFSSCVIRKEKAQRHHRDRPETKGFLWKKEPHLKILKSDYFPEGSGQATRDEGWFNRLPKSREKLLRGHSPLGSNQKAGKSLLNRHKQKKSLLKTGEWGGLLEHQAVTPT